MKKTKYDLYPKEKKNADFYNYSIFNFLWSTSNKMFSVNIEMPLITFEIPSFNIMVKQYIDFELLFYLFTINFDTWDFYVINYLSSFKLFRIILSGLMSIRPKKNKNIHLEKYKNKYFDNTDYKIINIITSNLLIEEKDIYEGKKSTKNFTKSKLKEISEINEEQNIINIESKKELEKKENEKEEKDINNKKEQIKDNNEENTSLIPISGTVQK